MNRKRLLTNALVLGLASGIAAASPVAEPIGVPWYSIDGGGGRSTVGSLTLTGAIGQTDAGAMTAGPYTINGGFYRVGRVVCTGDANRDGLVDFDDLLLVLGQWGQCPPTCDGDVNHDGAIDFEDLLTVLSNWNCGAPEG